MQFPPRSFTWCNEDHGARVESARDLACCRYNKLVKTWDVIIVGGGIIGLSLSISLRKRGASVLIVERREPGQEASHAAAGMLADFPLETPSILQPLATASARMYPEFVHELQDESGIDPDLRDQGTIFFPSLEHIRERSDPLGRSSASRAITGTRTRAGNFTARLDDSINLSVRTQRESANTYVRSPEGSQTSRSGHLVRNNSQ